MYKILLFLSFLGIFSSLSSQVLSLYFEHDQAILTPPEIDKLNELNRQQITILRIQSYCDSTGTAAYNRQLAKKRAQHIVSLLETTHPAFDIIHFGEEYPIPDKTLYKPADWRKVEIHYTSGKDTPPITAEESIPISPEEYPTSLFNDSLALRELIEEGEAIVLSILFVPGTNQLFDENSYNELWRLFDFMRTNTSMHAFIRGHVCCGSAGSLSFERAYTVYQFLTQRGISPKRLAYKGFDNELPLIEVEITEEDRQQNRRVDVIFTKIEK
jgi:outer membrane protein OmpA-like peptidoglycan-associated protein